MKVRVTFHTPDINVDEVVSGRSADEVVSKIKQGVAAHLGFPMRLVVNAMSSVVFAQEVVKRYNEALQKSLPPPHTSEEFLAMGEREGIVTVLER